MKPSATTVGGYLQSLPNDQRVAMARVCSMIRRSVRGVRESMRFGLAFYELDGPLFAVESEGDALRLFLAEKEVVEKFKDEVAILNVDRCALEFPDLTCLPLDTVEKIVRASLAVRRAKKPEDIPTQDDCLQMWKLSEEDVAVAPPIVRIIIDDPTPGA